MRSVSLDLCGFLANACEPEANLVLRTPDLTMLDAAQTYRLFAAISRAEYLPVGTHPLVLPKGQGSAVVTESADGERGIFIFGAPHLGQEETEQAVNFCQSFSSVLYAHNAPATNDELVEVAIDCKPDSSNAEVTFGSSVGFGSAPEPGHAVAMAMLGTLPDNKSKLVSVTEIQAIDGAVVLVVLNGDDQPVGMGAAPLAGNSNHAIAVATLRAARSS